MGTFYLQGNKQMVAGLPVGKLNDLDTRLDVIETSLSGGDYLRTNQTTPQTISNGIPLLNVNLTDFTNEKQIVNKEYVDNAINFISDYYFNNTADAIGGIYYQMTDRDLAEVGATLTTGSLTSGSDQAVFNFITSSALGVNKLNSGVYKVHIHSLKTGTRSVTLYVKIFVRTSGGTETLVATSTDTVELGLTDAEFDLNASVSSPVTINSTDKLVVKFFANVGASGSDVTISLNLEDDYNSRLSVPIESDVLNQIFIRQDGTKALTANWNAGAFDITADNFITNDATASRIASFGASKQLVALDTATYPSLTELTYLKGVTSSIQTQIDAKFTLPALTSGSILFSNGTTIAQDNANLFFDDTNNYVRLGAAISGPTVSSATTNLTVTKSNNGFITIDFQNRSNGSVASTDFIWYNDAGTDSTNYLDIGINSSTYTGSSILNGAGDAYIYNVSEDLMIGTATAGKNVVIFTGGTGGTAASKTRLTITDTNSQFANGTAAAPSIVFTGSTTTGFYRGGTDIIGYSIAGTSRLTHSATTWDLNSSNGGTMSVGGTSQYIDLGGTIVAGAATFQGLRTTGLIWDMQVSRTNSFGINNANTIGGSTGSLTLTTMSGNRSGNVLTGSVGITITTSNAFEAREFNNGSSGTVVVTNNWAFNASQNMATGSTLNGAFRGVNTAAATRWNLYMEGTAQNWLEGSTGIGVSAPATKLHVLQSSLGTGVLRLVSTATNDDPTFEFAQGRVATTNATITTVETIATTTDTTIQIKAEVIGRRTGGTSGTAGDGAGYFIIGTFKNIGGTVTQIGTTTNLHTAEDQAGWDCVFTISGTNILVQITGATNNQVVWHCHADYKQVGT